MRRRVICVGHSTGHHAVASIAHRAAQVDSSWRAGMSKSMEAALNMIEHAVYGIDLDTAIRVAVKNRKDCKTFLTTSPMSEIVTDVEEKIIAESSAKKAAQAAQEGEDDSEHSSETPQWCDDDDDGCGTHLPEEIHKYIKSAPDETREKLEHFRDLAVRRVETYVTLVTEVSDSAALTDRMKESAVNKLRLSLSADETKKYILHIYDVKNAGEASSHPSVRLPPLRGNGDHLKLHIRAALDAYTVAGNELSPHDMFLLLDGGRQGDRLSWATSGYDLTRALLPLCSLRLHFARLCFSAGVTLSYMLGKCLTRFPPSCVLTFVLSCVLFWLVGRRVSVLVPRPQDAAAGGLYGP